MEPERIADAFECEGHFANGLGVKCKRSPKTAARKASRRTVEVPVEDTIIDVIEERVSSSKADADDATLIERAELASAGAYQ